MHRHWPALLLLCLGAVITTALVTSSLRAPDAHAAKRRKKPKGQRTRGTDGHRHQPTSATSPRSGKSLPPIQRTRLHTRCPPEMVNVAGKFCIDRWEASVVDADSGRPLSPYYPPNPRLANMMHRRWQAAVKKEVSQARALMLEAGVIPPRGLGSWDADPAAWIDYDASSHAAGDAGAVDAGNAGDAEAAPPPLVPGPEAPHGWTLLGDDGDAARPRAVILVPILPPWQSDGSFRPKAVSRPNVRPQGYMPGFVVDTACRAAGKRPCREAEWVYACKGEHQTKHPYGKHYRQGRCNVFRDHHPGKILHDNWSVGLSDPRLNMLGDEKGPLLRNTGTTLRCVSVWGDDGIVDMVGNVDEWVDDPAGVFVGGFFSRNTRSGCEARVGAHPTVYFDYSTGFRCCADLRGGSTPSL